MTRTSFTVCHAAVRAAVEKHTVSRARYESYRKLRSEIEAEETI